MAEQTFDEVFNPNSAGAYDQYGTYYSGSDAYAQRVGNGDPDQIAYATFNAAAIQSQADTFEIAGDTVHVMLSYTLSTNDGQSHTVQLNEGYFNPIGYQTSFEGDTTNHTGPGGGTDAYVYDDALGQGETILASPRYTFGTDITMSNDVSSAVQSAASAGRDLVLTLSEPIAPDNGVGGGAYDFLGTPQITLEVTTPAPAPTVSGTMADQQVMAGDSDMPFSTVTLADPGNPVGTGDELSITILDPSGNGTDAYGTLTETNGATVTHDSGGNYSITGANTIAALQADLQNLRFAAAPGAGGDRAVFELDVQSSSGSTTDNQNTSVDITDEVLCFLAGTTIATPQGERAIETLRAGDLVLTAEGGAAPMRWLGRQTVATRFADPLRVAPIRIVAGALGEGLPMRDLFVSPDHALMVDGVFVQAGALVNGASITREDADMPERLVYFHVELVDHSLILAEGVAAETFIDNVGRLAFDNWDEHATLADGVAPMREMPHPRAKAYRQVPATLRARLLARGMELYGTTVAAVA